ncbi:MAG TPA: aminotransferase class V-fold PLP-dependent enzyme, partial [Enterococcus aquimarinus]|nr:aminotransferase class V-fold PLP-dependent enzyme [Enterococcus aquimarinus]
MNHTKLRQDFPILDQIVNDEPLIYLDNAATTQKPIPVLQAMDDYYHHNNANVHRGVHTLA